MYSGLSETAEDAIKYYGRKRFSTGLGVTQPSQIRFVRYFELVLKGVIKSPSMKLLKGVRMHRVPKMTKDWCRPYIDIITLKNFRKVFTSRNYDDLVKLREDRKSNTDENKYRSLTLEESDDLVKLEKSNRKKSGPPPVKF